MLCMVKAHENLLWLQTLKRQGLGWDKQDAKREREGLEGRSIWSPLTLTPGSENRWSKGIYLIRLTAREEGRGSNCNSPI